MFDGFLEHSEFKSRVWDYLEEDGVTEIVRKSKRFGELRDDFREDYPVEYDVEKDLFHISK